MFGRYIIGVLLGWVLSGASYTIYGDIGEVDLPTLSSDAKVSILTVDPGFEIHSIFGHCSIRIQDSQLGIDAVYGYGAVLTSQTRFFLESSVENRNGTFMRSTFDKYLESHLSRKRRVTECVLNLNQSQNQSISDRLLDEYLMKDRFYPYHPFRNNCATREFDLLISVLGDSLDFAMPLDALTESTFFKNIQPYFGNHPWTALGTNLSLGLGTHKRLTYREEAFLPKRLEEIVKETFITKESGMESLVYSINELVYDYGEVDSSGELNPKWLLYLVLGLSLVALVNEKLSGVYYSRLDFALFGFVTLLGLVLIYTSIYIAHDYSNNNYNLIWAFPLHAFAFVPFVNRALRLKYFAIWMGLYSLLFLVYWILLPPLFVQLWPLFLALIVRSYSITIAK